MAAIDPSHVAAASAADAVEREFAQLAGNARQLRAQLQDGAVVAARILRSNGLTDVVEILGRRVAAALPPDLHPGDVISVSVKGFDGQRLVLQRLPAEAEPPPQPQPEASPAQSGNPRSPSIPARTLSPAPTPPQGGADAASPGDRTSPNIDTVEARVAAARAAASSGPSRSAPSTSRTAAASTAPSARTPAAPAANAPARSLVPPPAARSVTTPPPAPSASVTPSVPRAVSASVSASVPRAASAAGTSPGVSPPATFVAPPLVTVSAPPQPALPQRFLDAAALLAALRVDLPPERVLTIRNVLKRPERLPEILRALDSALSAIDDERAAGVRATLGFIEHLDPQSPTLAVQIAAYVSHVLDGREPKLATFAAAAGAGDEPQAAGARLRIESDVATRVLDLLADPAVSPTPEFTTVAAATVGAAGALQHGTAVALARDPAAVTFALPIATGAGSQRAEIRIQRKGGDPKAPLDPNDVHIGFVLATGALGTVKVDLHSVDRSVRVRLTAEEPGAVKRFGASLSDLETRLERLRYRVAALDAGLAPPPQIAQAVADRAEEIVVAPPSGRLDLQI